MKTEWTIFTAEGRPFTVEAKSLSSAVRKSAGIQAETHVAIVRSDCLTKPAASPISAVFVSSRSGGESAR